MNNHEIIHIKRMKDLIKECIVDDIISSLNPIKMCANDKCTNDISNDSASSGGLCGICREKTAFGSMYDHAILKGTQ